MGGRAVRVGDIAAGRAGDKAIELKKFADVTGLTVQQQRQVSRA